MRFLHKDILDAMFIDDEMWYVYNGNGFIYYDLPIYDC